jgi:protein subunit release factor B
MLRVTSGIRCRSLDYWFRSFTSFKILRNEEQSKILQPNPLVELKKLKLKIPKANKMPARPSLPESDIQEKFIKGGSGKGGQKINKTNSKVQLTHIPTGIVVTSQATRSRDQNRKIAREILALKIDEMENGVQSRKGIVIARKQMQKQRAKKKTKAKYKKLAEAATQESDRAKDDDDNNDDVIVIVADEVIVDTNQKK